MNVRSLWEVYHSYYCNEGNYHMRGCGREFKRWQDFHAEMSSSDMDLNLLFRWDWYEKDDNGNFTFTGNENYRNGKLKLFWMEQRKGLYHYQIVDVCRADEPLVREFLQSRWLHLQSLWLPFEAASAGGQYVSPGSGMVVVPAELLAEATQS